MKKLLTLAGVCLMGITLAACGSNNSQDKTNSSLKAENASLREAEKVNIVGSYKDDSDGAAITFNSDHTGRYVYADPVNSDTDDQLTWKKNSDDTYTITLQDSNVNGSLTAKLNGNKLTLSSDNDSNWNTEAFTKVKGNLNLDKFLANKHVSSSNNSNTVSGDTSDSGQEKPLIKDGNKYVPEYDANGQIKEWTVTSPDGHVFHGGDPSPSWQRIESEYNALNNK